MIETLCLKSVADSPILGCVDQFFACVERNGINLPRGQILAKHRAQAYLAVHPGPQPFVGIAAQQGHWPFDRATFDAIKQFLMELCP